ncbi:MAG: TldD/PmbA family protein [Actinobacteria bacterium]|nr:TldD/PmbA family protein [Actinomycetota bacterium]MCL6104992.1 TldD/PmbA family protein [Actinomycetota bacterium]
MDVRTADMVDIAAKVCGWAQQSCPQENEDVEVYALRSHETSVRVFEGEVEQLSSAFTGGVGIRVIKDGRLGFAYAGSLEEPILKSTLNQARDNANFSTQNEYVALPVADGVPPADLDSELCYPGLDEFSTGDKIALAIDLDQTVRKLDTRVVQVPATDYEDTKVEYAIVSSKGIASSGRHTFCDLSTYVLVRDDSGKGKGDMQTGVGFCLARHPKALQVDKAANDALERAVCLLGATKPSSGQLTVVFDPRVTSVILSVLAGMLSGEVAQKGRSPFQNHVGEKIAPGEISIVDDPTNSSSWGASIYDAEGLACRRNLLIDQGVLKGFYYDTYAGNLAGTTSTASAVRGGYATTPQAGCRAVLLEGGIRDLTGVMGLEGGKDATAESIFLDQADIFAKVAHGVFVRSITGVHSGVNPVSGDFSVGIEGLMIRNGELAEPIREATIASTIQKMLLGIVALGNDIEWLPGIAAGMTLAIGEMSISGL